MYHGSHPGQLRERGGGKEEEGEGEREKQMDREIEKRREKNKKERETDKWEDWKVKSKAFVCAGYMILYIENLGEYTNTRTNRWI